MISLIQRDIDEATRMKRLRREIAINHAADIITPTARENTATAITPTITTSTTTDSNNTFFGSLFQPKSLWSVVRKSLTMIASGINTSGQPQTSPPQTTQTPQSSQEIPSQMTQHQPYRLPTSMHLTVGFAILRVEENRKVGGFTKFKI